VTVVPAIDVRGGRVVRLTQGELAEEKVYGSDPVGCARFWEGEGAQRLHVVDLDAALGGRPQFDVLAAIIEQVSVPVEAGGGLRVVENAMRYRDRGVDRLIFGTAAIASPGVVQKAVQLWPGRVAVALDARDGRVVVAGWTEVTEEGVLELARRVKDWGVTRLQYTDVLRDGTLVGPNLVGIEQVARESGLKITAAGGVATLDDLRRIAELEAWGVDEVVVGRALYERRFSLAEAVAAAGG
jgi:phosphoribosylformimino-5-aminoimidazole carboxamide ribotide isomerase